jgi:uncharacterized SAM-binding protein YcdF (DUF218 family)
MSVPFGFLLKKALAAMVMPLTVCLLFFALGLFYILLRRSREALAPFVIGSLLLYAVSLNTVSGYVVRPLERAYPALDLKSPALTQTPVKWVVVLGSAHWSDRLLPAPAMLADSALFRLAEGMRVANRLPESILVLSGGKFRDEQSCAQVMAAAAADLGFDPARIVLSDQALDTHDEALHLKEMLQDDAFVLVTSAAHMPRAVRLFQNQGLKPIPAPTDFRHKGEPEYLLPHAANIETCHLAVHEYLGLAWAFLRGQITLDAP